MRKAGEALPKASPPLRYRYPPRPRHAPRLHAARAIRRPISMLPGTPHAARAIRGLISIAPGKRHAVRAIRGLISMVPGTRHAAMLSALTQARNLSPIHAPCFGDALAPFEPSPFLIIIAARPMAGYAWGKREELCR